MKISLVDPGQAKKRRSKKPLTCILLAVGNEGGEATHTLTANEMPNHTHQYIDYWTVAAASGTGRQAVKFNNNNYSPESGGLSTGSSGGGKPHNNMPPYLAVYIWKRTA